MKHYRILFLFLLAGLFRLGAQENAPADNIKETVTERMLRQVSDFPEEKVYLQTDKPYYSAGDTIWFKAYLVHAALHKELNYSRYIYVELINDDNALIKRIKVRPEDGMFYCQMPISAEIASGQYSLRAYTYNMQNLPEDYFFRKQIYIGNLIKSSQSEGSGEDYGAASVGNARRESASGSDAGYGVQFFPEGGHLIAGALQTVGFKAVQRDGWSTEIHGRIVDDLGNETAQFSSTHKGMGSFAFMAEKGRRYHAVCEDYLGEELSVDLPAPCDSAYALSAIPRGNFLRIGVTTPDNAPLPAPMHLIVHVRGIPLLKASFLPERPMLDVPLDNLPAGVIQFLLIDDAGQLLSERLHFVRKESQAQVSIDFAKPVYGRRERVYGKMSVRDAQGNPLSGHFSVSVTDDNSVRLDSAGQTIESYLLLTSDLRGNIEDPGAYFLPGNLQSEQQLNLLMLTQGWRRYDMPKVIAGQGDPLDRFEWEAGSVLCGRLQTYPFRRAIPNNNISIFNSMNGYINAVITDSRGRFCIEGFEFPDSSSFFIQADKKQTTSIMELVIEQQTYPAITQSTLPAKDDLSDAVLQRFLHNSRDRYYYDNGAMVINLGEVSVEGKRSDNIRKERSAGYTFPSYTFEPEDIEDMAGLTLLDILIQAPGVTLNANGDGVLIRNATPLIVLDGVPAQMSDLSTIQPFDVEMIDILKDPTQTMIFQGGGNGVICIYLKRGQRNEEKELGSHQKVVPYLGYTSPKTFYQPIYSVDRIRNSTQPDLRTTMLWVPNLKTDGSGEAELRFYTGDTRTSYSLVLEGITESGQLVHYRTEIQQK